MKAPARPPASAFGTLACAAAFACGPTAAFAMQEGLYLGLSAAVEDLDASVFKTIDNRPEGNKSLSAGKVFTERSDDTRTSSGFGIVLGYQGPLRGGDLYWSGEISYAIHSGKARGRLHGTEDVEARRAYNEAAATDLPAFSVGPQVGENWPEEWTFEKDYSYGVTFRLGGRADFLTSMLGPEAGLYVLAGVHRVRAEYTNSGTGCFNVPADPPDRNFCESANEFMFASISNDRDYTAWTVGAGVHTALAERIGLQLEAYYMDHGSETLVQLDGTEDLRVSSVHEPEAEEIGLRLRLLRYF